MPQVNSTELIVKYRSALTKIISVNPKNPRKAIKELELIAKCFTLSNPDANEENSIQKKILASNLLKSLRLFVDSNIVNLQEKKNNSTELFQLIIVFDNIVSLLHNHVNWLMNYLSDKYLKTQLLKVKEIFNLSIIFNKVDVIKEITALLDIYVSNKVIAQELVFKFIDYTIDYRLVEGTQFIESINTVSINCFRSIFDNKVDSDLTNIIPSWKRILDLNKHISRYYMELTRYKTLRFLTSHPECFIRSLSHYKLSPVDLVALNKIISTSNQRNQLLDVFIESRQINITNTNFGKLLNQIHLVDPLSLDFEIEHHWCDLEYLLTPLRNSFKESNKNEVPLYLTMLKEMNIQFKTNYRQLRNYNGITLLQKPPKLQWIQSISSVILNYLNHPEDFLNNYYKPSLFRRVLLLNSEFSTLYYQESCLEFQFLKLLNSRISHKLQNINSLITAVQSGSSLPSEFQHAKIDHFNLLLNHDFFDWPNSINLEHAPCWPSSEFEAYWDCIVSQQKEFGKQLQGLFNFHILEICTPISLSNNRKLRIVTDLRISSILYLFNDHEYLTVEEVVNLLQIKDTKKEVLVRNSLQKLVSKRIFLLKNEKYHFNSTYKADKKTDTIGILRCF